jgi:hypothetical protein
MFYNYLEADALSIGQDIPPLFGLYPEPLDASTYPISLRFLLALSSRTFLVSYFMTLPVLKLQRVVIG